MIKRLFGHKHKWIAIKTIWPYKDGWGVYCRRCRTLLDIYSTKSEAEAVTLAMKEGR